MNKVQIVYSMEVGGKGKKEGRREVMKGKRQRERRRDGGNKEESKHTRVNLTQEENTRVN